MTAIEWLLDNAHVIPKTKLSTESLILLVKQMEREQIIESYVSGYLYMGDGDENNFEQACEEMYISISKK